MSNKIDVNPGQYKVAGRERMGENMTEAKDKQQLRQAGERNAHQKPSKKRQRVSDFLSSPAAQ